MFGIVPNLLLFQQQIGRSRRLLDEKARVDEQNHKRLKALEAEVARREANGETFAPLPRKAT